MPISVDLEAIGRRIEGLRGSLSQSGFAAKLGVDRKTVGTWERGERLPDTRALLGLWAEFDAEPAWVLIGEGSASSTPDAAERVLLDAYRACTPDARRNLIQTAALLSAGLDTGQAAGQINRGAGAVQISGSKNRVTTKRT